MHKPILSTLLILSILHFYSLTLFGQNRDDEIRQQMWNPHDSAFNASATHDKWANEEAVIIAQLNRFEYRKPIVIKEFHVTRYFHNRIKLNHKNAINEYTEMQFPADQGRKYHVYTGFKLIKSDGTEKILDLSEAVLMELEEGRNRNAYFKLAIPNLEAGDILDYYICEDEIVPLASQMYFFSPVQYYLPQVYPVMEQKLEFKVERRCFISMKSLNDAPELNMEIDEENNEQIYSLVDRNREAVKEFRWFYPYRELPTVKFRAAYASGKAQRQNDVLLGEPGEIKSEVSEKELAEFVTYILTNTLTNTKAMMKHVKKIPGKNASNFEIAKEGYYFRRNEELQWEEVTTISDKESWDQNLAMYKDNRIQSFDRYSAFLAGMDIPHDIVIAIPRHISSLDDLLLESEIQFLVRVKQGDEYLYFSEVGLHKLPGEFSPELMGTEAYIVDGRANFSDWDPKKITIPVSDNEHHKATRKLKLHILKDFNKVEMEVHTAVSGNLKPYHQQVLMDYYDYKDEEAVRYEINEDFKGTFWMKDRLFNLRNSYLADRDQLKNEILNAMVGQEYDFEVDTVSGLEIEHTGRYDDQSAMTYHFRMETGDILNKVGPNYLLDIGKLIEQQVRLEEDELERNMPVYISSPRSYACSITLAIPEGFEVQGIENLEYNVETSEGGFVSKAKVENNQLVIDTYKYYMHLVSKTETWPEMTKFINAAHEFTEQKVLLKKI